MCFQISLKNSTNVCKNTLWVWMWVNTYDSSGNRIDQKKIKHDGRHHHMKISSEAGNHVKMKLGVSYQASKKAWECWQVSDGDVIKFSGGADQTNEQTTGETEIGYRRVEDWKWGGSI